MTKVCYAALPRPEFRTLQTRIFPIYFRLQTMLVLVTAVTHPPRSLASLATAWYEAVPLGITFAMACLNRYVYGPMTISTMALRTHQGMSGDLGTFMLAWV